MTLRPWHLALLALVAFAALRFGWSEPRFISADEADTVQAGVDLVQQITNQDFEGGTKKRLEAGFATDEGHPRLDDFPPDQGYRRAVLEAPVPRWLAALGIGVLSGDETPNLTRTGTAAALATTLALVLLVLARWRRSFAALIVPLLLMALPGVLDAGVSAGYGAAALLVMAASCLLVDRLARTGRGALWVGLACGLAFGIHPMAIVLVIAVVIAYAIANAGTGTSESGFRLPRAPLGLFIIPIVAIVALVAVWPALWTETGKRLGAWLLDYGFYFNPPYEVADQVYHQHIDRAAPAWTALVQWVAWTPIPVAGLWVAGVARAIREGRRGQWFPIVAWLGLLLCGAMDGGLFGSRWSILPLLWVPTALTAADGLDAAWAWLGARPWRWALPVVVAVALFQALRVTTWDAATQTGSELRFPVSMAFVDDIEAADPGGVVAFVQGPIGEYLPQLEAACTHLEKDLRIGEPQNAGWLIVIGEPKPDSDRFLRGFSEVRRDGRGGLPLSLWRRDKG